jgi:hypothetical protein
MSQTATGCRLFESFGKVDDENACLALGMRPLSDDSYLVTRVFTRFFEGRHV